MGNWYVPYVYQVHSERNAPYMYLPEEVNSIDFGPVGAGMTQKRDDKETGELLEYAGVEGDRDHDLMVDIPASKGK